MITQTLIFDPMDQLAESFRRNGHPVAEITMEPGWIKGGEPDAVATEERIQRSFYAPHFHWRLEDGRRFYGKPKVHLKRHRVRKYFGLLDYEVVYEDQDAMLADLKSHDP